MIADILITAIVIIIIWKIVYALQDFASNQAAERKAREERDK